jgi:hypothetical protein
MKYRELLTKYMMHVMSEEGISFVREPFGGPEILSKVEMQELKKIESKASDRLQEINLKPEL